MPALDLEEDNNATTRLLTLLNVSALKSSKCKRTNPIEPTPRVKLNKRRSVRLDAAEPPPVVSKREEEKRETSPADPVDVGDVSPTEDIIEDDQGACGFLITNSPSPGVVLEEKQDPYEEHFGTQSTHLSPLSQGAMERNSWRSTRSNWRTLGPVTESVPDGSSLPALPTNGNPAAVSMFFLSSIHVIHDPPQPLSRFCRGSKSNSNAPKKS